MIPTMALVQAFVACSGDTPDPAVTRGGLSVRLVVADPTAPEEAEDPCEALDDLDSGDTGFPDTGDTGEDDDDDDQADDDDDDDDDDDAGDEPDDDDLMDGLVGVVWSRIDVRIDELRLHVTDDDTSQTFTVPVTRDVDLMGPSTVDDEIVLDLRLQEYPQTTIELVARSDDTRPAIFAEGTACTVVDGTPRSLPVALTFDPQIAFESPTFGLVLGNGPDPRVRFGLQIDQWLDGLAVPEGDVWQVDPLSGSYDQLVANLMSAVTIGVD